MQVLVIGGTRFVGYLLVWRLLARGDRVTILNRGTAGDPFGERVERVIVDRKSDALPRFIAARAHTFDAIVDFAAYEREDVEGVIAALLAASAHGVHYVFISTGQVYLVLRERRLPAKESDFDGAVMSEPSSPDDREQWAYGIGKRACETAVREAHRAHGLHTTSIRIPMVNGERDHFRRIENYLQRILDGGPIILPDGGGHYVRHVYGADVARAIEELIGERHAVGNAYNLSQDETPTLAAFLTELASITGAPARLVEVPRADVVQAGLRPTGVSPFSGTWMSMLDPSLAKKELAFKHRPLSVYLESIVASFLAHPPDSPPESYAHRARERELARRFGG